MHNRAVQIAIVLAVLAFCGYLVWEFSGPARPRPLPQGTQTMTGTLVPAELSLTRRGTHMLTVNGNTVAYVESPAVNLRQFELTEVGVTGRFEHNTDPSDMPVLVATSVRAIEIPAETLDLPSVGLTLRVPDDWNVQVFDDGVSFSLTGSSVPLLRVMRSSLTRLPEGTPMFIGGYDAVRIDGEDGAQTVHLEGGRTIVTFTWTPDGDDRYAPAFAQLLRTVIVRNAALSSRTSSGAQATSQTQATGSDAAATSARAQPCGGPAGVLCPAGTYCAVNSPDGVGTCVPL